VLLLLCVAISPTWAVTQSDNFNRADANPISGDWTPTTNDLTAQIVSNQVESTTAAGNSSNIRFTRFQPANDQSASLTVVNLTGTDATVAVVLRASAGSDQTFYVVGCTLTNDVIFSLKNAIWTLHTYVAGGCANGDVITGDATGSTITLKVNGTVRGTPFVDSTPIVSGFCGIHLEWPSAVTDAVVDTFSCSDTTTPAVTGRRMIVIQ
jgi:hypothetical protein